MNTLFAFQKDAKKGDGLLTIKQAGERLQVSERQIRRYIGQGLTVQRYSRRIVRIYELDLLAFAGRLKTKSAEVPAAEPDPPKAKQLPRVSRRRIAKQPTQFATHVVNQTKGTHMTTLVTDPPAKLPIDSSITVSILACETGVDEKLVSRLFQALVAWNDLTGLGYEGEPGQPLFLIVSSALHLPLGASSENWLRALQVLGEANPEVMAKPRLHNNCILYAHRRLLKRKDYNSIAPRLHRGLHRKLQQVARLPIADQRDAFDSFLSAVFAILKRLSSDHFLHTDFEIEYRVLAEVDRTIDQVVCSGKLDADSGLVYKNRWREIYCKEALGEFIDRQGSPHKPRPKFSRAQIEQIKEAGDPEALEGIDPDWEARVEHDAEAFKLDDEFKFTKRSKGWQVLAYNSSPYQQGAYSLPVLGLTLMVLEKRCQQLPALEATALRCLIATAMTTGRKLEWIAQCAIASMPHPNCLPSISCVDGFLRYQPEAFVGHPQWLTEQAQASASFIQEHHPGYQPISRCVSVPLPKTVIKQFHHLLTSGIQHITDVFSLTRIEAELCALDQALREQIPHVQHLSSARLAVSFDGHYAGLGLDPIHRFYVQDRTVQHLHMPLIYSYIQPDHFHANCIDAHHSFVSVLHEECVGIARMRPLPVPGWLADQHPIAAPFGSTVGWGSWRCAQPQAIAQLLELAHALPPRFETFILLMVLTGLRPFEGTRLRPHHLSADGKWLAVDGKDNVFHSAHRVIPICDWLQPHLLKLRNTEASWLFENLDGSPLDVSDVEKAIQQLALDHWLSSLPDLYSLRHAYRSSLLTMDVPYVAANYSMGHQCEGTNLFDPFLNVPSLDLTAIVERVACELMQHYQIAR
ncbi:MAG: tyrosine-type recombinase/integrase [Anaerolineae bacterium]|nr:tyrosine-type recombinase/integrase [Anaerolineae bacterium]